MVVINVAVMNCQPQTIVIGRRGTYDTMQIVFDLSNLIDAYGNGVAVLAVKRSQDESAYPAVTTQADNTLTWTVSETDTAYVGAGECQLMWYVDGGLAKTIIYPMVVMRDILATSEEAPDAYQTWVDDLTALGAETLQNAQNAAQSATDAENAATRAEDALEEFTTPTASATSLAPDQQATAAYSDGHFSFGIPRGTPGTTGETPDFSIGTIETLEPGQPATATITGTPENPVLNLGIPKGEKGEDGGGAVESVNGKTGVVVLDASDVGAKPASYEAPVSSVAGKTGAVTLNANDVAFSVSGTYDEGTVGAELSDQKNAIDTLESDLDEKAPVIINTASGDIATFADGADDMPIKHLVANIEAVQEGSGDPSPENIRPIAGWAGLTGARTGKNLLPNKVYQASATRVILGSESEAYNILLRPGTYTLSVKSEKLVGLYFRRSTDTANTTIVTSNVGSPGVRSGSFTLTDTALCMIWVYFGGGVLVSDIDQAQLNIGTVASEYATYQGQTISVSWADEAGTVYGGTLDVVTGKLTATYTKDSKTWGSLTLIETLTATIRKRFDYSSIASVTPGIRETAICNIAPYNSSSSLDDTHFYTMSAKVAAQIYLPVDTPDSTVIEICYPLYTPIVYQLAPVTVRTLLGNNTVYVDCGNVTVDYPADTGIVVAEQSNAIDQLEGQVVTDVTVAGTDVTIVAQANKRYLCGTVSTIAVTPCATGAFDLIFTSGSSAAILTIPSTVKWQDSSFDPTALDTDTIYEISVSDGVLGMVAKWT